ncbi:hypothetical protein K435DRAFT_810375 [Dendrothele bispora CBS 962.96]|uniref:G-protein coupled receptors family 2 profile 2 domain-containing protein n=1 Tax=Dendrothele bispora (strain CBS 962.96) TaxID=1314807 RepID=A0A4S8KVA6_DENBC|nr:hypothetical protein K435DRAFT_810375 [Dendrothele bispora CBS 962.96]
MWIFNFSGPGCLFFTISLNLQLVVIHEFSGRKFEKFYITGSAAIAIILTVPPYATGKFGWDPLEGCCWYSLKSSKEDKLIWEITTQMIWTALTAFGEFINSAYVIMDMEIQHYKKIFIRILNNGYHNHTYVLFLALCDDIEYDLCFGRATVYMVDVLLFMLFCQLQIQPSSVASNHFLITFWADTEVTNFQSQIWLHQKPN